MSSEEHRYGHLNFDAPDLLGAEFVPQKDDSFSLSTFTSVRFIEDLPPWILERIPSWRYKLDLELGENKKTGYVIKQYNKQNAFGLDDFKLFYREQNYPVSTLDYRKFTLIDKSTILQRRQEELNRYFFGSEDLLLPAHFLVAFTNDKRKKEPALYELQEKLPEYIFLSDVDEKINNFKFTKEQRKKIKKQAKSLLIILKRLYTENNDVVFKHFFPDFRPKNIAITENGDIKIFDINNWYKKDLSPEEDDIIEAVYDYSKELLKKLIRNI